MSDDNTKNARRRRVSFGGFSDPVRRPRYIVWTMVVALVFAAFMVAALGVTSTRWFCSEGCHKVQDDTITAYQHSSHSKISCMACHMPVGANPIVFVLHKAEALGELYLTVTNNYELPLNGHSELSLTMPSNQCTQCHVLEKRDISPTRGILIDHKAHKDNGVECTVCHNRIAHREDFQLILSDPQTDKPNRPHSDFMTMESCFRCHTQNNVKPAEGLPAAPGECTVCHPKGFPLKPESHNAPDFFPPGHGDLAKVEASRVETATIEIKKRDEELAVEGGHKEETLGLKLPSAELKTSCATCHADSFCEDCHGIPMPHPPAFRKGHGEVGKKNPKTCGKCHEGGETFCTRCHHGTSLGYRYDSKAKWLSVHPAAVSSVGAAACLDCHNPTYCSDCHVNGPGAAR